MRLPFAVKIRGEPAAVDRFQAELRRAHHPMDVDGESLVQTVEDMRECPAQLVYFTVRAGETVNARDFERDQQTVLSGPHDLIVNLDRIRHVPIQIEIGRKDCAGTLADFAQITGAKHSGGISSFC